jgi:hypothetical protein
VEIDTAFSAQVAQVSVAFMLLACPPESSAWLTSNCHPRFLFLFFVFLFRIAFLFLFSTTGTMGQGF